MQYRVLIALIIAVTGKIPAQQKVNPELNAAVAGWISVQRDAYQKGDVERFQPCDDTAAIVIRDIAGQSYTCASVRSHMRDRMGGTLAITVDSVQIDGDRASVYNHVRFDRQVFTTSGAMENRRIVAEHRDQWRRYAGTWKHVDMQELSPQQIWVNGIIRP